MNNMGAITKKKIKKFFELVLIEFPEWKIQFAKGGGDVCIKNRNRIFIDENIIGKYPWVAKERILHEFAHINTIESRGHGKEFYKEYIRLLKKYMIN